MKFNSHHRTMRGSAGYFWRRLFLKAGLLLTLVAGRGASASEIVPPDGLVEGRTYAEWTAAWWKWALEIPSDGRHPLKDRTGSDALRNQSGPVWFLAWYLGSATASTITRQIEVPEGKVLFLPLCGSDCSNVEPPPWHGETEEEMRACASSIRPTELACEIDGVVVTNLTDFATSSSLIEAVLPSQNILGVSGGPALAVGYGTHLMIRGWSPQLHTIRFFTRYAQFNVSWDITYRVTVYAPPALTIRSLPGTDLMELSWSRTSNFTLQQTDRLDAPAQWVAAQTVSSNSTDSTQVVTVTRALDNRFFRLIRP